ncbi:MAG: FG-GAP-like repeat-containing protein [Myxococcota bacterium]
MVSTWLLCLGCPAGGGDTSCTRSDECNADEICVDSECVPRATEDAGTDSGASDTGGADAPPMCSEDCGDGECIGGSCCDAANVCGDSCCGGGQVCSFLRCVTIGEECASEDDCADGEYCESLLGDSTMTCAGTPVSSGRCLPRPPACPDGTEPDPANPECVSACSFTPPAADFDVEELYSWGSFDGDNAEPNLTDVRNSPIVIQMDDDDCDGRITARDVAEIVITTSPRDQVVPRAGDLVVLAVLDGELQEKWRVPLALDPWTYLAAGNIDGAPGNEIVGCATGGGVVAYHVSGSRLVERWRVPTTPDPCVTPQIADVDQDGRAEVLAGGLFIAGEDGSTRYSFPGPIRSAVLANIDGDPEGRLEVIASRQAYRLEGGSFVEIVNMGGSDGGGNAIVVDLEAGGLPEIITVNQNEHLLWVWRFDEDAPTGVEWIRRALDINGTLDPTRCPDGSNGRTRGGGPPTASDVNADGVPDIAVAGGVGYAVFDGARLVDSAATDAETFFWVANTTDCSSARTGSSVFDFNGDGRAEVLYADEQTFRIYEGRGDGSSGARVLFETCNTNGTILEMPIVADVDADGQADIVVAANARYQRCADDPSRRISGVRVFGNNRGTWVRTRSVWNQHAYHITNIEEDGTVPQRQADNFRTPGLNNFRTNRQPGNEFAAADAVVSLIPICGPESFIEATVRNLGEAVLPRGATVRLTAGTPAMPGALLGTMTTTLALYPAQAESLSFPVDARFADGSAMFFAEVEVAAGTLECRSDNNLATELVRSCLL